MSDLDKKHAYFRFLHIKNRKTSKKNLFFEKKLI